MKQSLAFDEDAARREEAIYETPAAVNRRRLVREALDVRAGESVLSIGCGPGFEPVELAPVVGDGGRVLGIDRSEAMLALARRRCSSSPRVSIAAADAAVVPVAAGVFDAALAVQVYEYVDDVGAALEELERVLVPGGRAIVYDTDFDSLVWRSPNPDRMERILDAFDDHCPHPELGSRLAPHLRDVGLTVERIVPNTVLNTRLEEDAFCYRLLQFLEAYASGHDDIEPGVPSAWAEDLRELDESGGTFFSLTQYLYVVRKPPAAHEDDPRT